MAKTSFDRRFDTWMQDAEFAESYRLHRARIDAIDARMSVSDKERLFATLISIQTIAVLAKNGEMEPVKALEMIEAAAKAALLLGTNTGSSDEH